MLVIVADDLTGALDTAAPFAARGLHTEVALSISAAADSLALQPEVLSINLASREKSSREASRLMQQIVGLLPAQTKLFKKIDSRLKGHIAAELDAISYRKALVAPAIPAFGRIVQDGHVRGFGIATPISISEVMGHHMARSIVPDTITDEDLLNVVRSADADGVDLFVGAKGLAEALAYRMTGRADTGLIDPPVGPGLFVIGSHDGITIEQVEALRLLDTVDYNPAPNGIIAPSASGAGPVVLVQATEGESRIPSEEVADNLATSVHPRLTSRAQTMLLCGGATAEAVLAKMGVERFRLKGECLPGLGMAYAGGRCIIAKSGGFGQANTLAILAGKLRGAGVENGFAERNCT